MTSAPSPRSFPSLRSTLGSLLTNSPPALALASLLIVWLSSASLALAGSESDTANVDSAPVVVAAAESNSGVDPNYDSLTAEEVDPSAIAEAVVSTPVIAEPALPSPDDHYWIVSSWKSPQQFGGKPQQFRPEVTCYKTGVGYHSSTMKDLNDSLIPGVPICIVVHGSFMNHPSVRPESLATWKWLKSAGRPVQFIYFSWPSDRPITLAQIDIAILGNRASYNGFYLASLIKQLPADCPLSLVGHSHGTRLISSALHLMSGGDVEGISHPSARCSGRRIRTVFVASAIDHDWLNPGEHFGRALMCTESLINLRNHKDPALFIYPFRRLGSARALGCTGFTKSDRSDLRGWSGRVRDLDVSEWIGAKHMWPSYINKPGLARQLQNYLYFADQPAPIISEPLPVVPAIPSKG